MPRAAYVDGYSPIALSDFSGGLNLRDKSDAVDPREAIDLLNVSFTEHGAILQRDGYADLTPADLPERVDSLSVFYRVDGTRQLIAGCGSQLVALDTGGGIVAAQTGLTRNPYTFARFAAPGQEYLYAANASDPVQRWDGAVWAVPAATVNGVAGQSMPRPGALAVTATVPGNTSGTNASNRLIATAFGTQATAGPGGMATNPSRWFASNPGQPEIWETDGDGANGRGRNFGDLTPGDGEQIMAAVTWRELVFIFKETKFFVLWGEGTASDGTPVFNIREVVNSVGLASRLAVNVGRDGVYFLNRRGVYRTNGSDPVLLSDKLAPLWLGGIESYYQGEQINIAQIALARMCWHMEQLFVAVPTGNRAYNDRLLVYDTQHQWWTVYDIAASALAAFRRTDPAELHHGYATGPQRIGHRSFGSSDDRGQPIVSRWRSGWLDYGSSQQKTIRETKIWGSGALNIGFAVDFDPQLVAELPVAFIPQLPVPPTPVITADYAWVLANYATYQALFDDNPTYQALADKGT